MMKLVAQFQASTASHPLIQPGTLDPYAPPKAKLTKK
jgi:hypothetical protein